MVFGNIQMQNKITFLILFFIGSIVHAQFECPTITIPLDGDVDVPVSTTISWTAVDGVPSYLISLGTVPGGTDILDNRSTGSPSFTPELGLPENTDIYVTITLFFFNDDNIECPSEMFRTEDVTVPPICTEIISPIDGAINVSQVPTISWNHADTATGYNISIGTAPGNWDITENLVIENALFHEPTTELLPETEIFVRIIPFNENGPPLENCQVYRFITKEKAIVPVCTQLTSPFDGEVNVPLRPLLEWDLVPNADGYRVSIGTSATSNNIVENGAYPDNFTEVIDFLPNSTYYVTITPFTSAGGALGCSQTSFTTLLGCGPIEDPLTGELVTFGPEIAFPGEVALCLNENPTIITTENEADGHRWYKIKNDNTEQLLSESVDLSLFEAGHYRYEAYNVITHLGATYECADSKTFYVSSSEIATINEIEVENQSGFLQIKIMVTGLGDYQYSIDSIEGPYQQSNAFTNIPEGAHTIYVKDTNGCGITQKKVTKGITPEGFPTFFTPNGDGINDYWQFDPSDESDEDIVEAIYIFDRYGVLIEQLGPDSKGWNGIKDGIPMPSSDYWFRAVAFNKNEVSGHFSLKR